MTLPTLNGFTKKVSDLLDRPNTQMTANELKAWFDAAPEELRVFLNSRLTQIDTDFALKSEINGVVLGQILDGSLTDVKLSNTAGQAKDRLSKVITDLANFIATKGLVNGLASLGSDGQLVQKPYVTGTYTGDGTTSRLIPIGFQPKVLIVVPSTAKQFDNGSNNYSYTMGGVVTDVAPNLTAYNALTALSIVPTGFNVYSASDTSGIVNTVATNFNGTIYTYIAFK